MSVKRTPQRAAIFPSDAESIYGSLATPDKRRIEVPGGHEGFPIPSGPKNPRLAFEALADWLDDRFSG
jgi:hypothetical protein